MKKKIYLSVCIFAVLTLTAINVKTFLNTQGSSNLLKFTIESLANNETGSGESPNWQPFLKMGKKKIQDGFESVWVPATSGGYYYSYPKYIYLDCCVGSAESNLCNKTGEDSRCKNAIE